MVNKIGIVIVGATLVVAHCLIGGLAFADSYTQDGKPCPPECVSDSMEIVTWYPSPYNEYEELRLYPISDSNSQCNSDNRGLMYYDSDEDRVKLCKGPAGLNNWQDLGGGNDEPGTVFFSSGSSCPASSTTVGRYYTGVTQCGGSKCCNPGGGWIRPGGPIPSCPVQSDGTGNAAYGSTNYAIPTNDYLCAK